MRHNALKRDKSYCKVGSYTGGSVNYDPKDHFFHLDENKLKIKLAVKDFIDPDILGIKKPGWNPSTSVSPKVGLQKALFDIKFGFNDAKITELLPKQGYKSCTDLRNDLSGTIGVTVGWNMSHEFSKKEYKRKEERMFVFLLCVRLSDSLRSTFKQTLQMLSGKELNGRLYMKPAESIRYFNEQLRKQKEDEKIIRDKIFQESVDKAASKERQAALVFRYLEEKKLIDAQVNRRRMMREFTGRPDLSKTLKSAKELEHRHTGKWEKSKLDGKEMWSCCASEVKESAGCNLRVVDKMAWKYLT
eukprot:TRINITY_DN732_c0_g2_i3.p1 TRINITY_DN732_c0_g2~~TRINITY_DN732_c0_g2_i3.p1  ORF type:complete len:302 (-),score=114.93 TRINITY_DN732_c0_g2_i3:61-966(-)